MNVPVESLEVADEVVLDMTRSTFLVEGSPVLIIVSQVSVQNEIEELGKPTSNLSN